MQYKRILQWAILAACVVATILNLLYLTGVLGEHAATYGFLLLLICFIANLVLKRRFPDLPATPDTRIEKLRGILTAVFAVAWLVTVGFAFGISR